MVLIVTLGVIYFTVLHLRVSCSLAFLCSPARPILTLRFLQCPQQVFRQNKRATNVHDIIGFRIIVSPKSHVPGAPRSSSTAGSKDRLPSSAADGPGDHGQVDGVKKADLEEEVRVEEDVMGSGRWPEHTSSRSVFTVKTFPPPYRDLDSRLLHQVYEVLVGLYEEVPGRYKAS